MISAKEAVKGLGPKRTREIEEAWAPYAAAAARVDELEALCAQRRQEMAQAQPAAMAGAFVDVALLAQDRAKADALAAVVEAVERELATARQALSQAAAQYNRVIEGVQRRQRRMAALAQEIDRLMAEREAIHAELMQ